MKLLRTDIYIIHGIHTWVVENWHSLHWNLDPLLCSTAWQPQGWGSFKHILHYLFESWFSEELISPENQGFEFGSRMTGSDLSEKNPNCFKQFYNPGSYLFKLGSELESLLKKSNCADNKSTTLLIFKHLVNNFLYIKTFLFKIFSVMYHHLK